jgi:hypothetical protein
MKFNYKNLVFVICIIAILVAVSGCTTSSNNTTNNTTNSTTVIVKNNTNNQNTTTEISAAKAKELAAQYTGMGVTLGTPTLTTFNGVKVWKIPVTTVGTDESVDSIYINVITGKRVQ